VKILFITRSTLLSHRGGDTVQVIKTAEYLRLLDCEVQVSSTSENHIYGEYDIIHYFNLIRPADILYHVRKSKKPFVISTIYVDYSEFERKARQGIAGKLFRLLPADFIEYLKTVARMIINGEKIRSFEYLFFGQKRSIKKLLRKANMVLPNSTSEMNRIRVKYGVSGKRYQVVPNAIDPGTFRTDQNVSRDPDLIICVARIEGLKNQLNLIKAVKNTRFKLMLIGAVSANHQHYYDQCLIEAGTNVHFQDALPQQSLLEYYSRAKVHVLPSWFETTGLSSLEAAVMGCNIVITDKGDTREYFGDYAFYCDPESPESIFAAIQKAASVPFVGDLKTKILTNYTWTITAEKTRNAYLEVLRDHI
jgi:glycosyltransferase involved in cell wall biosynthesis